MTVHTKTVFAIVFVRQDKELVFGRFKHVMSSQTRLTASITLTLSENAKENRQSNTELNWQPKSILFCVYERLTISASGRCFV